MENRSDSTPAKLLALFWEFFKISLFVVGGGYAIAAVANEVFGEKRKWLKKGEILDNLPVISAIPGLIAGNTAIFTGLKTAGRIGALVALLGVALPSFIIFTAVSLFLGDLPRDNALLNGAFLGLRSALTGVVAATVFGAIKRKGIDWENGAGVELAPLSIRWRVISVAVFLAVVTVAAFCSWRTLAAFLGFGSICIGGGFPLVPFYDKVFVGEDALLIKLGAEEFSNLMALTQMTPGPVSVNAATYFGFRLAGVSGGLIATAALLTPSYFLMTAVLKGMHRFRKSRLMHAVIALLKPVAIMLMLIALWKFASLSVWSIDAIGCVDVNPFALLLAPSVTFLIARRKLSVMSAVALSAFLGVVFAACKYGII